MDAGLRGAVVRPGVAQGTVGAKRAEALEAIHLVLACAPAEARVGAALVNVHIALLPCNV